MEQYRPIENTIIIEFHPGALAYCPRSRTNRSVRPRTLRVGPTQDRPNTDYRGLWNSEIRFGVEISETEPCRTELFLEFRKSEKVCRGRLSERLV